MIASSRGPSEEAASSTAWTTNQVMIVAPNATRRAGDDRSPADAVRAQEAGGHRGEDQHRLEPFAEDDHPRVEDDRARGSACGDLGRVDRAGPTVAIR